MALRILTAMCAMVLAACSTPTAPPAATSSTTTTTAATTPMTTPTTAAPAPPPPPAQPQTRNWFDLDVGDCVTALPRIELGDVAVPVVDCGTPHVAEVFLRTPVEVNLAIADVADKQCRAGLAAYTAGAGSYSVTYLIDSNQDRTSNNPLPSTVICLLQSTGGQPLTGSPKRS